MKIIILIILGIVMLVCISSCSVYKEERFKNKLVEDFKSKGFNFNNPKYDTLKIDNVLIDTYITYSLSRNSYLIRIGFYSQKKQKIFVTKVLLGNKKILINKDIDLNYQLTNGIFTGDLVDSNDEGIIIINEKEIFKLTKNKKLAITIYFKIKNKEKSISIDMEQYTAKGIVWPT